MDPSWIVVGFALAVPFYLLLDAVLDHITWPFDRAANDRRKR